MMLLLSGDVIPHGWNVRLGYGKRAISGLPGETGKRCALGLDPFRRGFFDLLDRGADGDGACQIEQDVNMVFDRIDEHRGTAPILQDGCHVGMERIADIVGDESFTILGAEDEMDVQTGE